ncbi:MAG: helix-turn-helix domain-containing protein [Chloroflexi bacterium]|nr:helix-turn-helix domain-containing protein [Chloroflexota bacterium]
MLTIKEVAKRLGLSVSGVYNLLNDGKIEGHKIGGVYRFTEDQVLALLEQTKTSADDSKE